MIKMFSLLMKMWGKIKNLMMMSIIFQIAIIVSSLILLHTKTDTYNVSILYTVVGLYFSICTFVVWFKTHQSYKSKTY